MECFRCETEVLSGPGAALELKRLSPRRLWLVADPYFYQNGTAQRIAQASGAQEVAYFTEVQADPTVELAARATASLREFGADTVAALGGGSALDLGKAAVYFSGQRLPFAAIPTTAGSGSEMTDFAVLTHGGVKHPLVDASLRPRLALLDGQLLATAPPRLTADAGFDALSHALEAYTATNAGAFSDVLAREAFCAVYGCLPGAYGGRSQLLQRLHCASAMAGLAFNRAGLGLCHALSHSLGGAFHLPHGRLNAILLPAVLECNAYRAGEKYASLARAAGLGGSGVTVGVRNLKNGLVALRRQLGMPATLREAGIAPNRVWSRARELVQAAVQDPCCATNPVKVEAFMVRKVLEEVTGRG